MLGPTLSPSESVLSYDAIGHPRCYWSPGCAPGPIPTMPNVVVRLGLPGAATLPVSFGAALLRVLVHSEQEIVEERVDEIAFGCDECGVSDGGHRSDCEARMLGEPASCCRPRRTFRRE